MTVLSDYRLRLRRLLHDTSSTPPYWSDSNLNDYINQARNQVCAQTRCLRQLQSITLTSGTEVYSYPPGVIDVQGISVLFGNRRFPLRWYPFSFFNYAFRPYQTFTRLPASFSTYAENVYIAPVPDQNYSTEWDVAVTPSALVDDTVSDPIPLMYQPPIPFYAGYLAKYEQQAFEESSRFLNDYMLHLKMAIGQKFSARISHPEGYPL